MSVHLRGRSSYVCDVVKLVRLFRLLCGVWVVEGRRKDSCLSSPDRSFLLESRLGEGRDTFLWSSSAGRDI